MDIHNNTEDIVLRLVNEICDNIEKDGQDDSPCTCYQCRLDIACYVLNRSQARYVVSSRGVIRAESEKLEHQQEEADIITLVYDGLQRITATRRPHFAHDGALKAPIYNWEGPTFNYPTIVGRVFNGINFSPMHDIDILLFKGGQITEMIDPNWQNPFRLIANMDGCFSFWPRPEPAPAEGARIVREFSIVIEAPNFEPLRHYFKINLLADRLCSTSFSRSRTHKLQDLYLFPPNEAEDD